MPYIYTFLLLLLAAFANAQNPEKPRLITGPVIGAVSPTTARIWIAYKGGEGENLISLTDTVTKEMYRPTGHSKINDRKGNFALNVDFSGLKPGHTYRVVYAFDPIVPYPKCVFNTPTDSAVADMRFLLGSCAYMSPGFARFAFPGNAVRIFYYMKKKKADFMVWLGDNIYYMGKDYRSYDNMFERQLKIRNTFILLSDFLNTQPNYSIWDDHDYGWNNADRHFPLKDTAMKVYKGFWPNDYSQQDTFAGTYFTFRYNDAEFFMTDNRWYLDPEGDSTASFLGAAQIEWLKRKLLASNAAFKFVAIGSQVINDCYYGDSYAKYSVERNALLDFIADNNIPGVVFLTGDKHYTELSKRDWKGYPMYDFTCSPLTSPILPRKSLKAFKNSYSVNGTVLYRKNFGQISITGPEGNRVCKMEVFGKGGQQKWEYSISAADLKKQ